MKNIPTLCEVPWNVGLTIRRQSNIQTAEIQNIYSHEAWCMRKICSHETWNVDFTTRKNRIFRPQKGRKFLHSARYLETLISRIGRKSIFRLPKCWSLNPGFHDSAKIEFSSLQNGKKNELKNARCPLNRGFRISAKSHFQALKMNCFN